MINVESFFDIIDTQYIVLQVPIIYKQQIIDSVFIKYRIKKTTSEINRHCLV